MAGVVLEAGGRAGFRSSSCCSSMSPHNVSKPRFPLGVSKYKKKKNPVLYFLSDNVSYRLLLSLMDRSPLPFSLKILCGLLFSLLCSALSNSTWGPKLAALRENLLADGYSFSPLAFHHWELDQPFSQLHHCHQTWGGFCPSLLKVSCSSNSQWVLQGEFPNLVLLN